MQDVMYENEIMLAKLNKSNKIEVQTVSCDAPDDRPYSASLPNIFYLTHAPNSAVSVGYQDTVHDRNTLSTYILNS